MRCCLRNCQNLTPTARGYFTSIKYLYENVIISDSQNECYMGSYKARKMVIHSDIYLLVQVNYSLTTQVLMSYNCISRQDGQQIISGNILQNSALDKMVENK